MFYVNLREKKITKIYVRHFSSPNWLWHFLAFHNNVGGLSFPLSLKCASNGYQGSVWDILGQLFTGLILRSRVPPMAPRVQSRGLYFTSVSSQEPETVFRGHRRL